MCVCKCVSNFTTFNLQYLRQYVKYYIQTWHDGRLVDSLYIYAHAHFDYLALTQGHSGSANAKNQRCMLLVAKQAISIKLATTVGHFM